MSFFFVLLGIAVLMSVTSKSEIGHAIADAIRHNSGASKSVAKRREMEELRAEVDLLRSELDEVHHHLTESAERLDFAERMLSKSDTMGIGDQR